MSRIWKAGRFELELTQGKPLIMGIVNVTPDSFSDGGKFFHTLKAIDHARQLLESGANILDVGGESTRPGAAGVDVDEEWVRVSDVLRELISWNVPVSIDTMKATVMARAVDLGADILNDVNGFRDEGAEQVLTQSAAGAVVMHMKGEPRTMQDSPVYTHVVDEVADFLKFRIADLEQLGVAANRILVDPGFGFGKTLQHNIDLLRATEQFSALGAGVLVGVSRKRMIADLTGQTDPAARVSGSVAAAIYAAQQGAAVVRVHDVRETADALKVWSALTLS
ncbi:dihydropteroate synthase [Limnobacter thiooxidans]|uniref:Dihydropteroate synthase n=1 Tax=Limnobacter thiooxidans TaxID=131080 RepID=A0AA86MF81_9BURK|nr:dihydropteroate synthase [Limnobacter thiooxidans]BET26875.1 dihydropteroate synthase [Limnobacter thiooxidans]